MHRDQLLLVPPGLLVRLLARAYARGAASSRRVEPACGQDAAFRGDLPGGTGRAIR